METCKHPHPILVVDDDESILGLFKRILKNTPFKLMLASDSYKALEIIKTEEVDLLITDYRMPGMDGLELMEKAKEINPGAKRIMITGYADVDMIVEAINRGEVFRFLKKPWSPMEMRSLILQALEYIDLEREREELRKQLAEYNKQLEEIVEKRTQELRKTVAELEKANQIITETYEQLLQSDKMASLGLMAGTLAHDINNPLTVIMGRIQILMGKKDFPEKYKSSLEIMLKNVHRISHLVNSIKNYSRKSSGIKTRVPLKRLIDESVMLTNKYASKKMIEINVDIPDDLYVIGDMNQLEQVFVNLIQNAAQAIEEKGEITISAIRSGSFAEIKVSDTGIGIPEEKVNKIFDPFFTTKKEGTGLGLNICKRLIEEHGGLIRVESKVGVGTTFTILLPLHVQEEMKVENV